MKAKELLIDFINYAFLLVLIAFCVMFFTVGDRFFLFGKFLKIILPFSLFGIFFLIKFKMQRNTILKFSDEGVLNEIIGYFTEQDGFRDRIVLMLLPIMILAISFIDGNINFSDFIQAFSAFFYMLIWHKILFKARDDSPGIISLRNIDRVKDEIAIYLLPLLIISLGMFKTEVNIMLDFFQGLASFLSMLGWHYIIFREKN
jgi:hypothetical protein